MNFYYLCRESCLLLKTSFTLQNVIEMTCLEMIFLDFLWLWF